MVIELGKQKTLDVDQKAIKKISFAKNLDRDRNATMFFIVEEAKIFARFFTRSYKGIVNLFCFNIISV